ncbi:MAG TPA: hypothetical protein VEK15_30400 [Vicinamibacteria bacterium]|nr:hypothetical protein [Vicinamibacteria bacterium]
MVEAGDASSELHVVLSDSSITFWGVRRSSSEGFDFHAKLVA